MMQIRPAEPVYRKVKNRWVEVNPLDGVDAQVTVIGGIRYTLGRSSYSPGCAMDFCRAAWPWLENNSRHVIVRDVIEWLCDGRWSTERAYENEWTDFAVGRIKTDGDEWGVRVVSAALWMPGSKEHENAQAFKEWIR